MDYYSGIFIPDDRKTNNPGAAINFGGKVYYFRTAANSQQRVEALICNDPRNDVTKRDQWIVQVISKDQVGMDVRSTVSTAPVELSGALYLFWLNDRNVGAGHQEMSVTRLGEDSTWSKRAALHDADDTPLGSRSESISAVAIGPNLVLVTEVEQIGPKPAQIRWHLFNVANFAPGKAWRAQRSNGEGLLTFAKRSKAKIDESSVFSHAASAWLSQGGAETDKPDPSHGKLSQNYLVQSFEVSAAVDRHSIVAIIRLDTEGVPFISESIVQAWPYKHGIALQRDPGGRIVAVFMNPQDERRLYIRQLNSAESKRFTWYDEGLLFAQKKVESQYRPTHVFAEYPLDAQSSDPDDFYSRLFVFSTTTGIQAQQTTECQVAYFGRLERVKSIETLNLTEKSRSAERPGGYRILRGYIDGPMPMPNENVLHDSGAVKGAVTYGHTQTINTGRSLSKDWSVGVKTKGDVGIGAGLTWETSLSAGGGTTFGTETMTTTGQAQSQRNEILKDGTVNPHGTAFLDEIEITRNEFFFYPQYSNEPATDAASFARVYSTFSNTRAHRAFVETTVPGNLDSYKEEAWDKRMKERLGIDNYVKTRILAKALDLDANGSQNQALVFSWTDSGDVTSSTGWAATSFTESRWTFDSEIYAGANIDWWGVKASVMAGVSFSVEAEQKTRDEKSWGISASFAVPGEIDDPNAYESYSFGLYFLPADVEWTREFIALATDERMKKEVDPNSESWKIVFLLRHARRNGAPRDLTAYGISPSRIEALRADGILTIAQLCRRRYGVRPTLDSLGHRIAALSADQVDDRALLAAARDWSAANTYVSPRLR